MNACPTSFFNKLLAVFVAMTPLTSWLSLCHFGCGFAALGSCGLGIAKKLTTENAKFPFVVEKCKII
jgi:hypothetical protein